MTVCREASRVCSQVFMRTGYGQLGKVGGREGHHSFSWKAGSLEPLSYKSAQGSALERLSKARTENKEKPSKAVATISCNVTYCQHYKSLIETQFRLVGNSASSSSDSFQIRTAGEMGNTSKQKMWPTDFQQVSLLSAECLQFTVCILFTYLMFPV